MVIMSLTNVSLFTTLLGNGLILWMILFIMMPRELRKGDQGAMNRAIAAKVGQPESSYMV